VLNLSRHYLVPPTPLLVLVSIYIRFGGNYG
jgi:hypothetical protein